MRMMRYANCIALFAAALVCAEESAVTVTPYGYAQYRLREKVFLMDSAGGVSSADFYHQIGYYLGASAKIGDQFMAQAQIGNDWNSTEAVSYAANNHPSKKSSLYPYFSLAYAKWDPGFLHVLIGIQPVLDCGSLDLFERSLKVNTYKEACLVSWGVGTNSSLMGLKIGASILRDAFKLGIDFMTTVTESRQQALVPDAESNPPAILNILELPMAVDAFTITPQFVGILFRNHSSFDGTSDHEIGGGLKASYAVTKNVSVYLSGGFATFSNAVTGLPAGMTSFSRDTSGGAYQQMGVVGAAGTSVKLGPGTLLFDAKYSFDNNTEADDALTSYAFADLKYNWAVHKNFSIMPRFRSFTTIYPASVSGKTYKEELRPEVILTGKF